MITEHQVGLAVILIVMILASGLSFTFSSIHGTTNITTGIAEQHAIENHFNDDSYSASFSNTNSSQISPYAGQEMRDIKSLSDNDVQSLQNGTGEAFGGIAKLAELNGYPGPRHVLDMASELQLTDEQRMGIERIHQNMSSSAKSIGGAIIDTEHQIDGAFANKTIIQENLKFMLDKSADLYGQLRFVHLSAHLNTMQILSAGQVQTYNKIRGYESESAGSSPVSILSNEDSGRHHQH